MRLINVDTLRLEEFVGDVGRGGIPPYAILSHTWGEEEVSFKDLSAEDVQAAHAMKGYSKIVGCCLLAASEGLRYAWIDTCCIDKSSSAELSEAINSMFRWYRDSVVCFAYLSDVRDRDPGEKGCSNHFANSRWFTRGWTLQELLAPVEVVFLNQDWQEIGTKRTLSKAISEITKISEKALSDAEWDGYSVAQKISWAAGRQTTRQEDEAYCLMGLFNVNMPLLYGEGGRGSMRLQEEIMKRYDDQSIFAWSKGAHEQSHVQLSGLLAPSPHLFEHSSSIETLEDITPRVIQDQSEGNYMTPFEVPFEVVH
ncbi:heterokaryon incompatibility protein-domain-containing protein [Diplogelasinospora grovesii]|uniref:Heterokaryon incompatibility protein-domain-containing protein n=1 Tax=Diplogelasinospora grovesii TaxID=303347 RepID=A0AAN6S738_9PEZI|nr:heterokaryon incompatibility protein-domain-containing protein [Diplogelasinospora grovesii]